MDIAVVENIDGFGGFCGLDPGHGALDEAAAVTVGSDPECIVEDRVVHDVPSLLGDEIDQGLADRIGGSEAGEGKKQVQPGAGIRFGNPPVLDEQPGEGVVERGIAQGGALQARVRGHERRLDGVEIERTGPGHGVKGVDVGGLLDPGALLDRVPLRDQPPEEVLAGQVRLVGVVLRAGGVNAVDSSVLLVPVGGDVGVALAAPGIQPGGGLIGGGVVLDHEVVPVADPEGAVRSDFRADWSGPGVGRVVDIVGELPQLETGAPGVTLPLPHQLAGRR
ncbi:MAG: hypothetical protein GWO24_02985, partial [Akkermansiaceae bacterium]|nr:hypothetical protein [Akkermansiaceae bacterium]